MYFIFLRYFFHSINENNKFTTIFYNNNNNNITTNPCIFECINQTLVIERDSNCDNNTATGANFKVEVNKKLKFFFCLSNPYNH